MQKMALFIKLISSNNKAEELIKRRASAFTLLSLIALHAKRTPDHPDKELGLGEAWIGDRSYCGGSERIYRNDKKLLDDLGYCTFRVVNKRTIAKLCQSDIYDINLITERDGTRDGTGTNRKTINKELIRTKELNLLAAAASKSNFSPLSTKPLVGILGDRLEGLIAKHSAEKSPSLYPWQERGAFIAEKINLNLDVLGEDGKPVGGSWFQLFKRSEGKPEKKRNLEDAYQHLVDNPNTFGDLDKFRIFCKMYHHGREKVLKKQIPVPKATRLDSS